MATDMEMAPPRGDDDDDQEDVAAARAEVSVMAHNNNTNTGRGGRNNDPTQGEQALMGVREEIVDGGVAAFQAEDESGQLVRQAFLDFLMNYKQQVERDREDVDGQNDGNEDGNDDDRVMDETSFIRPYHEQAKHMADRLVPPDDQDDEEEDFNNRWGFRNTLLLNMEHVLQEDPELAEAIEGEFVRFESFLRQAVQTFVLQLYPRLHSLENNNNNGGSSRLLFFVAAYNLPTTPLPLRRALLTERIGTLCSFTGTVTRTSDVRPELLVATFRCQKCGLLAQNVPQQFHYTRPQLCKNPRCKNQSPMAFSLELRLSDLVDWQKLRVQEDSSHIPPGSMPRSTDVILRNEMVEHCKAGDKCVFVGTLVVLPDGSALARAGEATTARKTARRGNSEAATGGGGGVSGLKALGVRELTYRTCFVASSVLPADTINQANRNEQVVAKLLYGQRQEGRTMPTPSPAALPFSQSLAASSAHLNHDDPTPSEVAMEFTAAQRAEIRAMRNSPRLYEQMVASIAPTTFGHKTVKKGILLMLLGGVHKTTQADGIKLRGDINVCIIGDPSTAKSQFLKYVHSFLPNRTVYTSGKASSAAGLTAAVVRDADTGEFGIEAGALMLADNGICCIDEFDKMDPTDQVAIHEAMEQQTISITKAGIQATLNARASILAAANPIYGRYDRTKTLKANVALSAPILSRFDLFFVVLDECDPDTDRQVAKHILQVHRSGRGQDEDHNGGAIRPPFTKDQMRRYIKFARTLNPKLTKESQKVMIECYGKLRQGDSLGRSRSAYRITVRQLESMIRLSEAMARLYCADEIQPEYVREAYRLLKTSIIQVETSDVEVEDFDDYDDDQPLQGMASPGNDEDGNDEDMEDSQENTEESQGRLETQPKAVFNPGEYGGEEVTAAAEDAPMADTKPEAKTEPAAADEDGKKKKKKKKKKTKINFEEYEAITSAIAGHLRALEGDGDNDANVNYWTWDQVLEWYLEQIEQDIGDSMERLEEKRKMVNLVIRRLIDVDRILVTVGEVPKSKKEQGKTVLAVHPNYDIS